MKSSLTYPDRNRKSVVTLILLGLLFLIALKFVLNEVKYFSLDEAVLGSYFPHKWPLMGHLTGGILALLIGPFQFYSKLRNKYLKLHRTLGKIYLIAILIAVVSSTFLAWGKSMGIHWTWGFSLQILALAWFTTAFMAYRSIRLKRIEQHRLWMIRSYIVTFGFVAFRYLNDYSFLSEIGTFVERAPTIVWAVWAIPLLFAEVIFQWNKR